VIDAPPIRNLPVLMGAVRQERLDGELLLEQNDGARRLFFSRGEIIHLKSDVAGEQFGNYLLRQGILDFPALNELLANEERYRIGEKVIQWGMMSLEERDCHLASLQEQIMIHALEHAIITFEWTSGPMDRRLEQDLHFRLHHRAFVWSTFQESHHLTDLLDILAEETAWRWEGRKDLLDTVSDLPLNPGTAYALSFLGADPISFETFRSLSHLDEEGAGRLIAALWALGGLALTGGRLPSPVPKAKPQAAPPRPTPPVPVPAPPVPPPLPLIPPPKGSSPRASLPPLELEPSADTAQGQPEFLEVEAEPSQPAGEPPTVPVRGPLPRPETRAPLPEPPPPPLEPLPPPQIPAPQIPAPQPPPEEESSVRARRLLKRAHLQLLQDHTVEAVRTLEQSVQLQPEGDAAFEAWLLLGQLRLANPAWSTRAIDALQCASRIRPKAAEPWAAMGELYNRKGFQANAVACFRRALELDPSVPIPPDVDLTSLPEAEGGASAGGGGLFSRFRSILGRSDKS
jgi:hypothetical protein